MGTANAYLGAEPGQAPYVAAGHPAVEDVAHDRDLEALELPELVPEGEHVEQRLGGVLVLSITGVDHVGGDAIPQELRGTRGAVADHHHVDPHRFEVARGVNEGLAL